MSSECILFIFHLIEISFLFFILQYKYTTALFRAVP